MGSFAMVDCTTWAHGYDLTTDLNQLAMKFDADDLERTTFGSRYKKRTGGLRNTELNLAGYYTTDVDAAQFPALGVSDRVLTMTPDGLAGSVAYMVQIGNFKYELFDEVGSMTPFSLDCMGTSKAGVVRGRVAAAKQTVNATGPFGTAVHLSAAGSTDFVYATLHVFSAGTTATVKLQSDVAADFASPTDVATFSAATTAGGLWLPRHAGPNTDTYYRFNVSAITGSFTLAGAIGVQ